MDASMWAWNRDDPAEDGPRIALVVTDHEDQATLAGLPVDVLELRVDRFRDQTLERIKQTVQRRRQLGLPLIVTVRNDPAEGGTTGINDATKLAIFELAAPLVDLIDIEWSSPIRHRVVKRFRGSGVAILMSRHDFGGTPGREELETIYAACREAGADLVKIAAHANALDDFFRLLNFTLDHRRDRLITISMGALGALSRLVFPAAGSLLTYTFLDQPAAPGQVPLTDLVADCRRYYPNWNKAGANHT